MRLDINLASQPYEDARLFWLRWGTGLGLASVFTVALLAFTVSDWFAARHDHATIASYRAQIAQRDQTRLEAQEFLNRPDHRATRDQSQFINELIERKSLSWTHVLEDLEQVMPPRVHVVSIAPELDEDTNQLTLKLVVGGDSRERVIELAQRMEQSGHFNQTYITTETAQGAGTGDRVQFDINGIYVPEPELASTAAPTATSNSEKPKRSRP
jgi:type IV pilus assembly protein PilN